MNAKAAIKAAFPYTIPVLTGYLFLGIAFGVLLQSSGFGFLWAGFMSVTIFAGAMQFVAVSLMTEPFAPLSVFLVTLMVNARHLFYGFSMLEKLRGIGKYKPYIVFGMTDETFTLLYSTEPPKDVSRGTFYFFITLLNHCYWIGGGIIGALLGSQLRFDMTGIEFVMTAFLTAIVVEQLRAKHNRIPCIIGLVASAICLLVFGPERFLLPAMAALIVVLTIARSPLEKKLPKQKATESETLP
ncbi:MAG: AzlC family ABC transporter permease [Clostridiales bacterium]|nr:AzlC family ABC transporter permease [Clostridiales bacterium]